MTALFVLANVALAVHGLRMYQSRLDRREWESMRTFDELRRLLKVDQ
jgi:hypothetical protein